MEVDMGKRKRDSCERRLRTLSSVNIEKVVGTGTFGVVYQAIDRETGIRVALKKIKMEKEVQGFPITAIREIKILKALKHENIVRLLEIVTYDAEEDGEELRGNADMANGDVFMVFEFCDFDLSGLLRSQEVTLTPAHVKSYMKQLLSGIHYIHKNKILHRDIKGANILVTRDNIVKIADWGLARTVYYADKQKLTNPVVTQWYRSPELLLGADHYGPEIDIWSLGCLFGEMLNANHEPMFRGNTDVNQLELIYQDCGSPAGDVEEYYRKLPKFESLVISRTHSSRLQRKYGHQYDAATLDLLMQMIDLHPKRRISAEKALDMDYFWRPAPPAPDKLPQFTVTSAFALQEDHRLREEHRQRELKQQAEQADRQARAAAAATGTAGSGGGGRGMGGRGMAGGRGVGPLVGGRSKMFSSSKFVIAKPTRGASGGVVNPPAAPSKEPPNEDTSNPGSQH